MGISFLTTLLCKSASTRCIERLRGLCSRKKNFPSWPQVIWTGWGNTPTSLLSEKRWFSETNWWTMVLTSLRVSHTSRLLRRTRCSSHWVSTSNQSKQLLIGNWKKQSHVSFTSLFCWQVFKTRSNVLNSMKIIWLTAQNGQNENQILGFKSSQ